MVLGESSRSTIMGDSAVSSDTMLEAPPDDSSVDFDYMDDLFLDGCWLETTLDGSDFPLQSPCPNPLLDPSFSRPALEANDPPHNGDQLGTQSPLFDESEEAPFGTQPISQDIVNVADSCNQQCQSEIHSVEGTSEGVRRWGIAPSANVEPGSSVMEKLIRALVCIKDLNRAKDVLIQIWVPVDRGDRRILTTHDLPFAVKTSCPNLEKYREISVKYQFSAEEDSKGLAPGLPGRVFLGKVPEWTPDVRLFRSEEYPRVDHAQECEVRGTLALPIFEQGSRSCLGVIEVVMTTQQINYGPELESVCKALEVNRPNMKSSSKLINDWRKVVNLQAVDLRSSKLSSIRSLKLECNKSYEAALPEIQEVLRSACETHKLPLAQTWVPCIQQGKEGYRHSEDNYLHCISPVEHGCYVGDPSIRYFPEACSEHHLLKGQGVAGAAFKTNQPCFSTDITFLSKTDYPLSHHARMFGLRAAAAIRLRSIHCSGHDFVLEFFLPLDCNDSEEQKKILTSLSIIIQRVCRSLRVITEKELEKESDLSVDEVIASAESCRFVRSAI